MKKIVFIILPAIVLLILQMEIYADESREYIVKLKDTIQLLSENTEADLEPLIPKLGLYTTKNINDLDADLFEFVEEDAPVELFDTYDYGPIITQQEYAITGIKNVWDIGVYGKGIRVGVIDSGCNQHQYLANNLCEGANFANDSNEITDNIGHGTAVCGIIGAEYGNGKLIGIAHKSDIVPLKFIDKDSEGNTIGGTTKRLVSAIISAVDDYNCDIINMSCGTIDSHTLKSAIDYAVSKEVAIVAAVGNDGSSKYNYPAAYDNVIGVGAVNDNKQHSSFSNINDSVFVTSPGENINILSGISSTSANSGTSFSAPYVSGIVASMLSIKPELTVQETMNVIAETSEDLGDDGYDEIYGYGLIRADNIIDYMLSECECFVSEVDECSEDGMSEVRFRFKADKKNVYFAEYIDNVLNQLDATAKRIGDNTYMLRLQPNHGGMFRYFVWNGMQPVAVNSKIK